MKTTSHNLGRQHGVSLLEILVVLVLLLIGIFSVIRLFPPGFLINKQVGEATAAGRLGKQEMDRYINGASNLMDAIVPIRPKPTGSGYAFVVDTAVTPTDLTQADDSYGVWAPYFSDVNITRRIVAEQVRIPLPTSTSLGRGSIYMLSSGPFMDVSWDGQNRAIFIYGAPLIRSYPVDVLGPGGLPTYESLNLRPSNYAIDYGGKQMMFLAAAYDRQFLLNISYYNTAGQLTQLIDITVNVPANTYDWVSIPGLPADLSSLAAFTDTCSRKFTDLTNTFTTWSKQDPYEFYLDPTQSPTIGVANGIQANVGVIVFNPLGRNYTEFTPSGPKPLTARIDYDVLDWHIIREDRPLPTSTPFEVAVSLQGLKKLGDIEDDQTVYSDLFYGVTRSGAGQFGAAADVMVYNASTGTFVDPADYTVNYKDGIVTFSDAFGQNNASATMRFFYRAHGDWSLQIQKACATYRQRYSADASPGFSEFYIGGWNGGGGSPTRIYFPLSEAGKTVSIREYWYKTSSGDVRRAANETFRINSNRALFENPSGNQPLTWIDIALTHNAAPDLATSFDTSSTGYAVLGMQGLSFRTRVLWKSGSQVTSTSQGNIVSSRWKHADLDTILTRSKQ